jgi:tetratricopeptide (TPR) repeat protein
MLPLAQLAYRYVSIFYQFGIPIDLELLARSLNHSYEEFVNSVYDPASLGVIIDDEEQRNVIRFRGRSRMVCQRIVEHCYPDPSDWLGDLATIVGSLMPQNANEIDTIRRLLILKMGPRGAQPFGDVRQMRVIFERAFDAGMRDSATLHHFALLLLDLEDFAQAEQFLGQALAVIDDERELSHFKTESRQNLFNSMGMVFGRRGLRLQLTGKESEATPQFDRATRYFRSARAGTSPSAYPYYCESFINYSRARNSIGAAKLPFLASAFKNLDESDANAPDDDKSSIGEMEAKILQYIATYLPDIDELIEAQVARGNPDGDYLNVRIKLGAEVGQSQRAAAYDILTGALARTPRHVGCLRLAARLHILLYPEDWDGWSRLLHRWYQADDQPEQCGLLFDLGYSSCELGRYTEAARYFERLGQVSLGHPRRSGIVKKVIDGKVERRLSGVIRTIISPVEAWIRCDTIGQDLKFLPIKQRFTVAREQTVTFSIALNYRGMLAIELRPA